LIRGWDLALQRLKFLITVADLDIRRGTGRHRAEHSTRTGRGG
jgi:hypothetical protein